MEGIQSCVKIAMKKKVPKDVYASCLLAGYVGAVLLHLPTDGMPAFGEYSRMLPEGLRLFATYVMAHHTYLNGGDMECLWDGEGCFVYGGEVVSDQYDVYPLYDGGVCDQPESISRRHRRRCSGAGSWRRWMGFWSLLLSIMGFAGADRGLYPEPGSGGVSADHGGCDFFQQGLDGAS